MLRAGPLAFVAAMTVMLGGAWLLRGHYPVAVAPVAPAPWVAPHAEQAPGMSGRRTDSSGYAGGSAASTKGRKAELTRQLEEVEVQISEEQAYLQEHVRELERLSDARSEERLSDEQSQVQNQLRQMPATAGPGAGGQSQQEIFGKYAAEEQVRATERQQRLVRLQNEQELLQRQAAKVDALRAAIREREATNVVTDELLYLQQQAPIEERRLQDLQIQVATMSREISAAEALDERERRWEERADQQRLAQQAGEAGDRMRQLTVRDKELEKQQGEVRQKREAAANEVTEVQRRIDELERRRAQIQRELQAS